MKVINRRTFLAWFCPQCGEVNREQISVFDFSGQDKLSINCSCGFNKLNLGKKADGSYWVEYFCILCASRHLISYDEHKFWLPQVKVLSCPSYGLELAYLGANKEITPLVKGKEDELRKAEEELLTHLPLRKLKKIKILEGMMEALTRPPLEQ